MTKTVAQIAAELKAAHAAKKTASLAFLNKAVATAKPSTARKSLLDLPRAITTKAKPDDATTTPPKETTPEPTRKPAGFTLPVVTPRVVPSGQRSVDNLSNDVSSERPNGHDVVDRDALQQQPAVNTTSAAVASIQPADPEPVVSIRELPETEIVAHLRNANDTIISINGLTLDASQVAAVEGMLQQKYAALIGYAGTGKSTTLDAFVANLRETTDERRITSAFHPKYDGCDFKSLPIAFCAYTGRAVTQIMNKLDGKLRQQCMTVHSLLNYCPEVEEVPDATAPSGYRKKRTFEPQFTENNKFPWEVIIIDEAGMLPAKQWNELLLAKQAGCRIFLVGDISQLPPIHGHSPLALCMQKWPTYELTQIHRQAAGNPIIANSARIREGKMLKPDNRLVVSMGVHVETIKAASRTLEFIKLMDNNGAFDPATDTLIVPTNVSAAGTFYFNAILSRHFNPGERVDVVTNIGRYKYRVGDRVMALQNDWPRQVANGMTGRVVDIYPNTEYKGELAPDQVGERNFDPDTTGVLETNFDDVFADMEAQRTNADKADKEGKTQQQASHVVCVVFDELDPSHIVRYRRSGELNKLTHSYAITCHKSQGGQYRNVVVLCHSSDARMLNREWLYTAATRAKERLYVLSDAMGLKKALTRQQITGETIIEKARNMEIKAARKRAMHGDEAVLPLIPPRSSYNANEFYIEDEVIEI